MCNVPFQSTIASFPMVSPGVSLPVCRPSGTGGFVEPCEMEAFHNYAAIVYIFSENIYIVSFLLNKVFCQRHFGAWMVLSKDTIG